MIDCYRILEVKRTASSAEIKSAYRKLARARHPDFNAGSPKAAREFALLSITALAAGFGWQISYQIAGLLAAFDAAPLGLGDALGVSWPVASNRLTLDPWPVLPFLGLGAIAAAFRYAERLQRDTEGLV